VYQFFISATFFNRLQGRKFQKLVLIARSFNSTPKGGNSKTRTSVEYTGGGCKTMSQNILKYIGSGCVGVGGEVGGVDFAPPTATPMT